MEKRVYVYGPTGGQLIQREETEEERLYRENSQNRVRTPTIEDRVAELELISQMILEGIE